MATVQIKHNAEDGTLVYGTSRDDGSSDILKGSGFRWFRSLRLWGVPQSRDRSAKTWIINGAADKLRAAGFEVEVEIDRTVRDAAEVAADREERFEDRRDALENKADRLSGESDRRRSEADRLADAMNGQPILVGHHSEKRHRKDIDKMWGNMRQSVELGREATEAARRADSSRREAAFRETGPALLRRIERLEAELRRVERSLTPCKASGKRVKPEAQGRSGWTCPLCYAKLELGETVPDHGVPTGDGLEALKEQRTRLEGDIVYCRSRLDAAKEAGYHVWGPSDFKIGDAVNYWGGWRRVVRVNPKSLSVETEYSWTDKVTYDDVKGRTSAEELAAAEAKQQEQQQEEQPAEGQLPLL